MPVNIHRTQDGQRLTSEARLPRPRPEVFDFFTDAGNLERLTPSFLRFEVLSERPIEMTEGAVIDYALRVRGIPMRWRSEIAVWDPPRRFVDVQMKGPYRFWRHEHTFEADGDATIVRDRVDYRVPGGRLIHALFVKRDVRRIFEHRERELKRIFPAEPGGSHRERRHRHEHDGAAATGYRVGEASR